MSITCRVCGSEFFTTKEAFDCETRCREAQDNTEHDGVIYSIRVIKRDVADFNVQVSVHYELEEAIQSKIIAMPCYFNFKDKIWSSDDVNYVYPRGSLRTYQLEDGLEAIKSAWREVIKNRLTKCIKFKRDVQLECETLNTMLENLDKIDDNYWGKLSAVRHASIRIGPVPVR